MRVYGYGSLIWRVDFPYKRKLVGYIQGYKRRFWQGSTYHRGVPDKPGRVVTLIKSEDPKEKVWGVAYEISEEDEATVIANLDNREKGGYGLVDVKFYPKNANEPPIDLQLYLATEDSKNHLGPAPISEIAKQIIGSEGLSGSNTDYVLQLAQAMRSIAPDEEDVHLFELEKEINLQQSQSENSVV